MKQNLEIKKSPKKNLLAQEEANHSLDKNVKINKVLTVLLGVITGLVSGLFGGGGGMIAVPILTSILKKPQKVAHATAILVIFPITIISGLIYSVFGSFDYRVVLPSTLGVILGGVLGAICLKKLSNEVLRIIFSVVMLIFGVRLIFS